MESKLFLGGPLAGCVYGMMIQGQETSGIQVESRVG